LKLAKWCTLKQPAIFLLVLFPFNTEGKIVYVSALQDGDLTTPHHGSDEHVTRDDGRLVGNMMIPHHFIISRAAGGKIISFFEAVITRIASE
jgi:hypothetical protein